MANFWGGVATGFTPTYQQGLQAASRREQAEAMKAASLVPSLNSRLSLLKQQQAETFQDLSPEIQSIEAQLAGFSRPQGGRLGNPLGSLLGDGVAALGRGTLGLIGGAVNPEISARQGLVAGINQRDGVSALDTFNIIPGETKGRPVYQGQNPALDAAIQQIPSNNNPENIAARQQAFERYRNAQTQTIPGGSQTVQPGSAQNVMGMRDAISKRFSNIDLTDLEDGQVSAFAQRAPRFLGTLNRFQNPNNVKQARDIILNGVNPVEIQKQLDGLISKTAIDGNELTKVKDTVVGFNKASRAVDRMIARLETNKNLVGGFNPKMNQLEAEYNLPWVSTQQGIDYKAHEGDVAVLKQAKKKAEELGGAVSEFEGKIGFGEIPDVNIRTDVAIQQLKEFKKNLTDNTSDIIDSYKKSGKELGDLENVILKEKPSEGSNIDKVFSSGNPTDITSLARQELANRKKKVSATAKPTPGLIDAVIQKESGNDPNAKSNAGAVGLMQLLPETARAMGLRVDSEVDERLDPEKNKQAGTKYLGSLIQQYKGNVAEALMHYNGGASAVQYFRKRKNQGIQNVYDPNADRKLFKNQTADYVISILGNMGLSPSQFGY